MTRRIHGYVTHANANRRRFVGLFLGYIVGFELVGAFALTIILLLADREHSIVLDPVGYALRYGGPVALVAALVFWRLYRGHAAHVAEALDVRTVSRAEEPRFVAIAEAQCTALGVRLPRFGIIEARELNALTVGDGPARGLIAVTRGLLERLDDDELAAVLAHEASHVRNGDTRVLAANHALMRTAVLFQTHNMLRIEDWRQMWLPLLLPPMLPLMLMGGAATMLSMRYARWAQRGVRLSRDHVADGEAVRVTHFPEALLTALDKIGGRGAFRRSHLVDPLLFDGLADHEGGRHPAVIDRMRAIAELGRDLMDPERGRRDTRACRNHHVGESAPRGAFGVRSAPEASGAAPGGRFHFVYDAAGKPLEEPPTPTAEMLWLRFTDPAAYRRWTRGLTAWHEWRERDRRNAFGIAPRMLLPLAATLALLVFFHWPADADAVRFAQIFDPQHAASWAQAVSEEVFASDAGLRTLQASAPAPIPEPVASPSQQAANDDLVLTLMSLLVLFFLGCAIFSPQTLLRLFAVKKERS